MDDVTSLVPIGKTDWYEVTEVGVRFREGAAPTFDQYQHAVVLWSDVYRFSRWTLGDMIAYGETQFGETYVQAMELTGLEYGTLANYASVARAFPLERRRVGVPIGFHASVMSLPAPQQDTLLDKAQEEGWSRDVLRQAVKVQKEQALPEPEPEPTISVGEMTLREIVAAYVRCRESGEWEGADEYYNQMKVMVGERNNGMRHSSSG